MSDGLRGGFGSMGLEPRSNIGRATLSHSIDAVAREGAVVIIGFTTGMDATLALHLVLARQIEFRGDRSGYARRNGTNDPFHDYAGYSARNWPSAVNGGRYGGL